MPDTECFAGPRDISVELAAGYYRGGVITRQLTRITSGVQLRNSLEAGGAATKSLANSA